MDNFEIKDVLLTLKPTSINEGLEEMSNLDRNPRVIKYIDDGVAHVNLGDNYETFIKKLNQYKPIFIQHVFPIMKSFFIEKSDSDLIIIKNAIQKNMHFLDPDRTFSVQTQLLGKLKYPYKRLDINQLISDCIINKNKLNLNVKSPQQVISIVLTDKEGFIGLSLTENNISNWAGGKHFFAKEKGQISRAEFKLLEAFDVFNISLPKSGLALDLGAAPGGWTRILIKKGFTVVAVDPANLHQTIQRNPRVIHYKEKAEEFITKHQNKGYDLIVNDMKMNSDESVKLMGLMSTFLKRNGVAIITLKIRKKNSQKQIKDALAKLKKWYIITGSRQLFHNRSEITVILRKK